MSSLSVKVDENLGQSHVERLRDASYDADRVHDQRLSGVNPAVLIGVRFPLK